MAHEGGIESINGDATSLQTLLEGANITISDGGAGAHTIGFDSSETISSLTITTLTATTLIATDEVALVA